MPSWTSLQTEPGWRWWVMWYLEASWGWGGKKFRSLDSIHGFCHLLKLAAPDFLREGPLRLALREVSLSMPPWGHSGFPRIKLLLERKKNASCSKYISSQGCLQGKISFFSCVPESTGMWENHCYDQTTHLSPPLGCCTHVHMNGQWTVSIARPKLGTVAECCP